MKKKYIVLTIIILIIMFFWGVMAVHELLYGAYNEQGISKYPCITIDEDAPEQYVCENSGYKVYTYKLSDIYFTTKTAEVITLKEALTTDKLTVEEIVEVCRKQKDEDKIYLGENYKIVISDEKCVIGPREE